MFAAIILFPLSRESDVWACNEQLHVIASGAKQSMTPLAERWIASSLALLAMTAVSTSAENRENKAGNP
jgi:hypothetical protein